MSLFSLQAFAAQVREQPAVRELLAASRSPQEILALARRSGFHFSSEELRQASRSLAANHWPWGGKGVRMRHAFFGQQALQVENSS